MTDTFAQQQRDAIRGIFAAVTATSVESFSSDGVLVTTRPEPAPWPFVAMIVGFGLGLVVCVEERYLEWAREQATSDAPRANHLAIPLAAEASRRGESLHPFPPMIGWSLAERVPAPPLPSGYTLARVEKPWMDQRQPSDRFTNALGLAVQVHRTYRNQFAYVASDPAGEPAAVAGVFDTAGLSEIGVDVAAAHRDLGLAKVVVSAAAAAILDAGQTPFYVCEVRNIRSQHTALASGFMPVCTLSTVMPAGLGLA